MTISGVAIPATRAEIFSEPIVGSFLRHAETWANGLEIAPDEQDRSVAYGVWLAQSAVLGCIEMAGLNLALGNTDQFFQMLGHGDLQEVMLNHRGQYYEFKMADHLRHKGELPISRQSVDGDIRSTTSVRTEGVTFDSYASTTPLLSSVILGPNDETSGTVELQHIAKLIGNTSSINARELRRWTLSWINPGSDTKYARTFAAQRPLNQSCGEYISLLVKEDVIDVESGVANARLQYREFPNLHSGRLSTWYEPRVVEAMLS
jgi:hypothetical protein